MRQYRLSNDAKDDLRRIYEYGYQQFGEQQADRYYYAFFSLFEKLTKNPYVYPSVDQIRTGYRRAPCGENSIYYRVTETHIEILAILGGQDVEQWL